MMTTNKLTHLHLTIGLALITLIVAYWPALKYSIEVWSDDGTYSHGFLNIAICFYILFTVDKQYIRLRSKQSVKLLAFFVCSILIGYLSHTYGENFVHRLMFFISIVSGLYCFYDHRSVVRLIPALAIFSFALPIWGLSISSLQIMAANVVGYLVSLTGLEVLINGVLISIPVGTFEVADGCSGLRYILVSMTITTLYGFKYLDSYKDCFWLFLAGLALSIITNWVRTLYLIYVGHSSQMSDPLMDDHNMLGWIVFQVPVILIFFIGRYLGHSIESKK